MRNSVHAGLAATLERALAQFGSDTLNDVPGFGSRVAFHASQRYSVAGSLTFFPKHQPEIEAVVVGVQLTCESRCNWCIDVIDDQAVVIAELNEPTPSEAARMACDPAVARDVLQRFLNSRNR